jgi:hypothetical protein
MNQLIYFIMSYLQEHCINLKTSFPWTSRIDATVKRALSTGNKSPEYKRGVDGRKETEYR